MAHRLEMNADLIAYALEVGTRETAVLKALREKTESLQFSDMRVPQEEGQLLHFLIKAIGARKVLELGVFTGYSSLWMATALPEDGKLLAIDKRDDWAEIATNHWELAGVRDRIDFRIGRAEGIMTELIEAGEAGSFDFIYVDADKKAYGVYYELGLELLREGGMMAFDNMLRSGDVVKSAVSDPAIDAIRALNAKLKVDDRVTISILPFADGLTLVLKSDGADRKDL